MWVAKFKIKHITCKLTPKCVRHKITDYVYLLNSWVKDDDFYYTELHFLQGKEKQKRLFIEEMKKDKSFAKVETRGDQILTLNILQGAENKYSDAFDPQLIYVKPWIVNHDGYEYWEVACWSKEPLMAITRIEDMEVEIKSIKQTKVADFFIPQIHPKLSPKQKEAIELAVKEGYYNWPKKIDLEKLAQISKVKRQTYQENLRRAEKKLVPFLTENIQS